MSWSEYELRTENERLEGEIEELREEKLNASRFERLQDAMNEGGVYWQKIVEEIEARSVTDKT